MYQHPTFKGETNYKRETNYRFATDFEENDCEEKILLLLNPLEFPSLKTEENLPIQPLYAQFDRKQEQIILYIIYAYITIFKVLFWKDNSLR